MYLASDTTGGWQFASDMIIYHLPSAYRFRAMLPLILSIDDVENISAAQSTCWLRGDTLR